MEIGRDDWVAGGHEVAVEHGDEELEKDGAEDEPEAGSGYGDQVGRRILCGMVSFLLLVVVPLQVLVLTSNAAIITGSLLLDVGDMAIEEGSPLICGSRFCHVDIQYLPLRLFYYALTPPLR